MLDSAAGTTYTYEYVCVYTVCMPARKTRRKIMSVEHEIIKIVYSRPVSPIKADRISHVYIITRSVAYAHAYYI